MDKFGAGINPDPRPGGSGREFEDAPVASDSVTLKNGQGDQLDIPKISFRCNGCGFAHHTVVFPWTPRIAKFHCRRCEYVSEIKTRDSAMDTIEGHIEEGAHEEKLKKRKSVIVRGRQEFR